MLQIICYTSMIAIMFASTPARAQAKQELDVEQKTTMLLIGISFAQKYCKEFGYRVVDNSAGWFRQNSIDPRDYQNGPKQQHVSDMSAAFEAIILKNKETKLYCEETAKSFPQTIFKDVSQPDQEASAKTSLSKSTPESLKEPESARKIGAIDFYANPERWDRKLVEIAPMKCYFAKVDEFRCFASKITDPAFTVFVSKFDKPAIQQHIEARCDMLERVMKSDDCSVALVFESTSNA